MRYSSSLVTLNERAETIWIDEAWYGGSGWPGGVHEQDECGGSSCGPLWPPYDTEARFVWKKYGDDDGKVHRQTVRIDPPIPDSFVGRIYFRFQPDGSIKVTPVTREEYYGIDDMSEKEILRWKDRQERIVK